jgi:ATP-dependent helicase/nuclease subunit A
VSHLTAAQHRAIAAEGNLLVLAGAGTGKTKTLVERCIARLVDPKSPASIDEFLMVTFTEAAAAEMKSRIREAIGAGAACPRLDEQLALLGTADIGTLHSFCLKLVRQHFHQLELDPQLTVLEEGAARLMMDEALDEVLEQALKRPSVRELAETQGGEYWLRRLLFRLHDYTQTLADPEAWFAAQRSAALAQWEQWLLQGFEEFKAYWIPVLQAEPAKNPRAHVWALHLQRFAAIASRQEIAACLAPIVEEEWPYGTKQFKKALSGFCEGAEFLHAVCMGEALREDWDWTRGHMETLLGLAQEFSRAYAERKRDEAMLDFHDFEQFTLRLLRTTSLRNFQHVFVDECQDINAAQDAILRAVSHQSLFLVGDVKQSIYRFRLADPRIFQDYKARWEKEGRVVPLADNFRSRAALLDFINPLFSDLMQFGVGGVVYDQGAILRCAGEWPILPDEPAVEVHFLTDGGDPAPEESESLIAEMTRTEKEAAIVARRLRELKDLPLMICEKGAMRPVEWKDFVVLMRSPANKAETYAKAFSRWNIPLQAEQGDFYECSEISDLLSLLQVLDNPLQDVPLLAVLRSPIVGLSLDELAEIRLANSRGQFWKALARWHEIHPEPESKVSLLLKRFSRWRQIARETSLSQRLETILNETFYLEWLRTQSRAELRLANVRRFLTLAQQFDPLQRHGLKRFLRFVEGQRETDVNSEPVATANANAVQLMSIHKSKGLEFPVVVLADLAKPFNFSDLSGRVLLDEVYGLCPQVKPPTANAVYPSLPHWLASKRQRRESIGEELRLLYVAMTRAKDRLVLTSAIPSNAAEKWPTAVLSAHKLISARSYIDWLGPWFTARAAQPDWLDQPRGKCKLFEWFTHQAPPAQAELPLKTDAPNTPQPDFVPEKAEDSWIYPHSSATRELATQRVTSLRERLTEDDVASPRTVILQPAKTRISLSPRELGNAHHQFLQLMALDGPWTEGALKQQAEAMHKAGYLADFENLDYAAVLSFWQSELGQRVLTNRRFLHREIPFTARMSPADVKAAGLAADEFIIVRGAVDLAVILQDEIWVIDFKTDALHNGGLTEALRIYAPQVQLYGRALERIYRRPAVLYLHFLAVNRTVKIDPHQTCTESAEKIFSSTAR